MTTPLRQDLIRLANEVPALRQHIVPLLRSAGSKTAEDYDTLKDRALEQGTWRDRKRRRPFPSKPVQPTKFRADSSHSRITLRGVMDMGFSKPRPYEAQLVTRQDGSGLINCTMQLGSATPPRGALAGAEPSLHPVAKGLARASNVFYEKDRTGRGMQLRGEYVLPGGTPGKASKPVSDMNAASADFLKLIKKGW
jgi:hypothetical protein